jgi:hypothetical protein
MITATGVERLTAASAETKITVDSINLAALAMATITDTQPKTVASKTRSGTIAQLIAKAQLMVFGIVNPLRTFDMAVPPMTGLGNAADGISAMTATGTITVSSWR